VILSYATAAGPGARTGSGPAKDCGIGRFPPGSLAVNKALQSAPLTAATFLAWLKLLALTPPGQGRAEDPASLHAPARPTHDGRQRRLNIQAS
jgi:hypothetical protein